MLIRLGEVGQGSQNQLGRLIAMDGCPGTAKGVVDRLSAKGLITLAPDAADARRRVILAFRAEGRRILGALRARGTTITEATLAPPTQASATPSLRSCAS
ncbi:MAG: hypothetical protein AcusKO_49490 [Acuticoccus sp.]